MKKILIMIAAITTTFLTAGYSNAISVSAADCNTKLVNGSNATQCDIKSFSDYCNSEQIKQFMGSNGCDITNIATNYDCNTILDAIKNNCIATESVNGNACLPLDNSNCNAVQGILQRNCDTNDVTDVTQCTPTTTETQESASVTEAATQETVAATENAKPEVLAQPEVIAQAECVVPEVDTAVNGCTSLADILKQMQCKPFSEMALNSVCDKLLQTQSNANCVKLPFCLNDTTSAETTQAPVTQAPVETTTEATTTQSTTTTQAPATTTSPVVEAPSSDYATEVVRLVNIERTKNGLSPLTMTQNLNNAATVRANEIVTSFSHTRPDGTSCFTVLKDLGISYNACGENIAAGQRTPAEVVNAWMNSEGHRANILNSSFNKIGVGVVENSSSYGIYWSQMFTN